MSVSEFPVRVVVSKRNGRYIGHVLCLLYESLKRFGIHLAEEDDGAVVFEMRVESAEDLKNVVRSVLELMLSILDKYRELPMGVRLYSRSGSELASMFLYSGSTDREIVAKTLIDLVSNLAQGPATTIEADIVKIIIGQAQQTQ